jgi:predicted CXXCH cytochrome family protein
MKSSYIYILPTFIFLFFMFQPFSYCGATENSECFECHSDEALERVESEGMKAGIFVNEYKFKNSVHNINSVACIDCHADITELNYDLEVPHSSNLAPVDCGACHEDEAEAYENSVHKKAGGKGISIPCYACHDYHYVRPLEGYTVTERENEFCLKCHDPNKFHDWLPQKETHFDHVECAVCHAPDAPRHIHLRFYDLVENAYLESDEILAALNTDHENFLKLLDTNKNSIIEVDEFEKMVFLLRQSNIRVTFRGELLSEMEPVIHHINRGEAKRECETCHLPTSPFFEAVTIVLDNEDGRISHYEVERRVLETYYVNHFYVIGGTRVRLLDRIGLVLLLGGVSVVLVHLSVRVVTAPLRRRKKEKKDEFTA